MCQFNFYSILFNSQTCRQGNNPLTLQPILRSYQVLLCPMKQKWYQTYRRLILLNNSVVLNISLQVYSILLTYRPISNETALQLQGQQDAVGAYIWASRYQWCVKFFMCVRDARVVQQCCIFQGLVEMCEVEGVDLYWTFISHRVCRC